MSNLAEGGRIELNDRFGLTEYRVLDGSLNELSRGLGRVELDVDAGLYQIDLRAGGETAQQIVSVKPGEVYVLDEGLQIAAAAPVFGTETSREAHHYPILEASENLARAGGFDAGLVISLRNLPERSTVSAESQLHRLGLFRAADMDPVTNLEPGAWTVLDEDLALWAQGLDPGPYVLRTTRIPSKARMAAGIEEEVFDQAVWLADGWQTLIFLPNHRNGPKTDLASVQMGRVGEGWSTGMDGERVQLAVEQAYAGLRSGDYAMSDHAMSLLLDREDRNAMFSILAAHQLFLQPQPNLDLIHDIVAYLDNIAPGHPDASGIRARLETRAWRVGGSVDAPVGAVDWPPTLDVGYTAAIDVDSAVPGFVSPGSLAARVATHRDDRGIWTSWQPLDDPMVEERLTRRARPSKRETAGKLPLGLDYGTVEQATVVSSDVATRQVADYLSQLGEVYDPESVTEDPDIDTLISQVSRGAKLPTSIVRDSLDRLSSGDL